MRGERKEVGVGVGVGRAPWPPTEPKARGHDRRGTGVPTAPAPHDLRPFPALEKDVDDERGAAALGSNLGPVPGSPDLRWGRGRLLHAGPEPRASDARVLLLCGSSGPGGRGRGFYSKATRPPGSRWKHWDARLWPQRVRPPSGQRPTHGCALRALHPPVLPPTPPRLIWKPWRWHPPYTQGNNSESSAEEVAHIIRN